MTDQTVRFISMVTNDSMGVILEIYQTLFSRKYSSHKRIVIILDVLITLL